uniref:Uncharacterized protein n=1 Tax=Cacopsylla melanoneura TaxID=428564 RepID=A0A8D8TUU2_9HEMI
MNMETPYKELYEELHKFLLEETEVAFGPFGEPNSVLYTTCSMINTLVATKRACEKKIIELTKTVAQCQRTHLAFAALPPSADTSYVVRTATRADTTLETAIDAAQTVYDLSLPFNVYKKLVKLLLVAENEKAATSLVTRPTVQVFWPQNNEFKQFVNTFFEGSFECANNWFSTLIVRTMIKSIANNRLIDNTTDVCDIDSLKSKTKPPPNNFITPVINDLIVITERIVDAIMRIDEQNPWLVYFTQNATNRYLASSLARFMNVAKHYDNIRLQSGESNVNDHYVLNDLISQLTQIQAVGPMEEIPVKSDYNMYKTFRKMCSDDSLRNYLLVREIHTLYKVMDLLPVIPNRSLTQSLKTEDMEY